MKAVILAAGEGTRMRPLTYTTPKPLIKLGNKSLLEHLVLSLPKKVTELILVVGHLGEKIREHCSDTFCGRSIKYVWQEEKKGTYHALELCKSLLNQNEPFAVLYADDLIDRATFEKCLEHDLAAITKTVENPRRWGIVTLNDDGSIKDIVEKPESPESNLALISGFVLNSSIFNYAPAQHPNGEYYLSTAVAKMAKDHKIFSVQAQSWIPVGTLDDLKKAEELLHNLS